MKQPLRLFNILNLVITLLSTIGLIASLYIVLRSTVVFPYLTILSLFTMPAIAVGFFQYSLPLKTPVIIGKAFMIAASLVLIGFCIAVIKQVNYKIIASIISTIILVPNTFLLIFYLINYQSIIDNLPIRRDKTVSSHHEELIALKDLYDRGIITEEEYNEKKKKYVDQL